MLSDEIKDYLTYENFIAYYNSILIGFACFFFIIIFVLYYHGIFHQVAVKVTRPPYANDLIVLYKFTQNYAKSRELLSEIQTIAPDSDSFSIYHEDFFQTRSQVGSSIGVVVSDSTEDDLCSKLIQAGYRVAVLPAIDYAVVSSFPYRNQYSLAVAVYRVYPRLKQYLKNYRLCAHPIMELYTKNQVFFIAPLSKQFDFYADEAIPEYEDSSSEGEEELERDHPSSTLKCRKQCYQKSLKDHCYCDPMLHSSSCDKRKRAL
ncbi:testis-expressed protein 264 homolog [Parasteatoda tepidariorum]|uniref:testis-expressed protein 264 homolog n=1 Tax=Parasteatoda tepidariorum TaxID=114398 RepID=UPI00077FA87F|nr:testis-expressed protein 264 homolog [Parasteatoda tepidariorum]